MYTVIWKSIAEEEFRWLCDQYDEPGVILNAARRIESKLLLNAHEAGEGRESDDTRMIFEPPLGVAFWVSELDRVAMITAVWRTD